MKTITDGNDVTIIIVMFNFGKYVSKNKVII